MIDHLVYATPDLDETVETLRNDCGIDLIAGGPHIGRGTRNYLAGLGDGRYLEVIGPDPDQGRPTVPRPFGIDDIDEARLVTWCARPSRPLDEVAVRVRAAGYDLGTIMEMSRRRPDGVLLEWELTVRPGKPHALIPFCINWGATPHPTTTLGETTILRALCLLDPEPTAIQNVLRAIGEEIDVRQGDRSLEAELTTPRGSLTLR